VGQLNSHKKRFHNEKSNPFLRSGGLLFAFIQQAETVFAVLNRAKPRLKTERKHSVTPYGSVYGVTLCFYFMMNFAKSR